MKKYKNTKLISILIILIFLVIGIIVISGCGKPKEIKTEEINISEVEKKAERELKEETKKISEEKQLTAREALAIAEVKAKEWSLAAKLVRIISGPDIKEDGTSGYWTFKFRIPGDEESLLNVDIKGGAIENTEAKKFKYYDKVPLPEGWLDSKDAYQKSYNEFKKLHATDFSDYKVSPLGLQCATSPPMMGNDFPKPCWFLTFYKEKELAKAAVIDAVTGEFVMEWKQNNYFLIVYQYISILF